MMKLLYGLLFVVVIPVGLWCWGHLTASHFATEFAPPYDLGMALCLFGGCLLVWSMLSLMVHGRGLPMNAFPPPRFVSQGPYRLLSHPIYVGFCLLLYGVAIIG